MIEILAKCVFEGYERQVEANSLKIMLLDVFVFVLVIFFRIRSSSAR